MRYCKQLAVGNYKLESPLWGGDLGVGKSVIREIFTEIPRPRNPPLTPPKRGIICAIIKYLVLAKTGSGFKLNTDNRSLSVSPQNPPVCVRGRTGRHEYNGNPYTI